MATLVEFLSAGVFKFSGKVYIFHWFHWIFSITGYIICLKQSYSKRYNLNLPTLFEILIKVADKNATKEGNQLYSYRLSKLNSCKSAHGRLVKRSSWNLKAEIRKTNSKMRKKLWKTNYSCLNRGWIRFLIKRRNPIFNKEAEFSFRVKRRNSIFKKRQNSLFK